MQIDVSKLTTEQPKPRTGTVNPVRTMRRIFTGAPASRQETLFFQLATMVDSGVGIREALFTLSRQYRGRAGSVFSALANDVSAGGSLCEAMSRQPDSFNPVTLAMVETGEKVGRLEENLRQLADAFQRTRRLSMRLVTGFIYPILLLHAAILIPNLVVLFSHGLWGYVKACSFPLAAIYGTVITIWFLHQVFKETKAYGGLLLSLPVVEKLALARFARALATLYEGGLAMGQATELAGQASGNGIIREELEEAAVEIRGGIQLGAALEGSPYFPEMVRNMIETGEHTGRLEVTLRKVAEYYEDSADASIERTARILPVVLYLFVAGYIAYVVFSMWAGVYGQILSL